MAGYAKRGRDDNFDFSDAAAALEAAADDPDAPGSGDMSLTQINARLVGLPPPAEPAAPEEEPAPSPVIYEPRPLKSRRRERKALGKPGRRATCFLCAYVGERDATIPGDDVAKIVEMLRQNTGRMDSSVLAQQVADFYATLRTRVNRQLLAGEIPLPAMNAATVLEHIRRHQQDAEVKQIVMLEELQEIRETLMDSVLEQNPRTRHVRGNLAQLSALDKVIKLELLVHSKDPAKMSMYCAGTRVNPANRSAGPVHTSTKTLYSYWGAQ